VANILARPLMKLAPADGTAPAPGGSLILSGILERQRDAVVAAYVGQRFRHVSTTAPRGLGDDPPEALVRRPQIIETRAAGAAARRL
jgi:hypothetical protein